MEEVLPQTHADGRRPRTGRPGRFVQVPPAPDRRGRGRSPTPFGRRDTLLLLKGWRGSGTCSRRCTEVNHSLSEDRFLIMCPLGARPGIVGRFGRLSGPEVIVCDCLRGSAVKPLPSFHYSIIPSFLIRSPLLPLLFHVDEIAFTLARIVQGAGRRSQEP